MSEPVASSVTEAERTLERLRSIPPQHATAETVAAYQGAILQLAHLVGSRVWCDAHVGLGAHLLESPHGDRSANIEMACRVYRALLDQVSGDSEADLWEAALAGLANALVLNPSASGSDFNEAAAVYDRLIPHLRAAADAGRLAVVLGNQARMYAALREGDVDAHLDRAIALQEEAILALKGSTDPQTVSLRARGLHNLAAHYLNRRTGLRSQNVDRAVRALEAALGDRPADRDPVGRARTLRGLAIAYPEWGGAESLKHARQLAEQAADEAAWIERGDARAAQRATGPALLERQRSALSEDLDRLYELPPADRLGWLGGVAANHLAALEAIDRNRMPVQWAEWAGGLARMLGRLPSLGVHDRVEDAHRYFALALETIQRDEHPRLYRELLHRWGELAHEIGDFDLSMKTYGGASDLSEELFSSFADPKHQWSELERTKGYGLFSAYAAARVGRPEEALRYAEQEKTRALADLFDARRALTTASVTERDAIGEAVARVLASEESLRGLDQRDPEAEIARVRARLADALGVDASTLSMRRTDDARDDPSPVALERARLRRTLEDERHALRVLLRPKGDRGPSAPTAFGYREISQAARAAARPLVYLMATAHGGMAIAAFPDGECATLALDLLTSDLTVRLAYGDEKATGFVGLAMTEDSAELAPILDIVRQEVGRALMTPLTSWLGLKGAKCAVLVPVGSLGLLPLHLAEDGSVAFSYAPSARALTVAADTAGRTVDHGAVVVADPRHDGASSLPFSVAEARTLARLVSAHTNVRVLVGVAATLAEVHAEVSGAACVHFACHAGFRPSDPLASRLLLAGKDELTLADVFSGRTDLARARVVNLAACQSGSVEYRRAADESLGFPGALMVGGVSGVVSTMWSVDDAAAALFSVRFYELWLKEGHDVASAVAGARRWLREATAKDLQGAVSLMGAALRPEDAEASAALSELSRELAATNEKSAPFDSPLHWGAFILTGI